MLTCPVMSHGPTTINHARRANRGRYLGKVPINEELRSSVDFLTAFQSGSVLQSVRGFIVHFLFDLEWGALYSRFALSRVA